MSRRLSILITSALLFSGCNTFRTDLTTRDAQDENMSTTDVSAPGDMDGSDRGPGPDLPEAADMRDMNRSDLATMDMADAGDMPNPDPGAAVEQYVWTGTPDPPLTVSTEACTVDARRSFVDLGSRPSSNTIAPEIEFVPLHHATVRMARLGWIDDGVPNSADITIDQAGRNVPGTTTPLESLAPTPVTDMALGPGLASTSYVYATTTGGCATPDPLITTFDSLGISTVPCPNYPIRVTAVEAGNGYDPFLGTRSVLTPTLVWQEVVGEMEPLLVASGNSFGVESAISASWPNPIMNDAQNFSIPTHGRLAFFPDAQGSLWAWNVTDASSTAPGVPPLETGLNVVKGAFDVVSLSPERYVTAQVVQDRIDLFAYDGEQATSRFTPQGLWFAVTGLSNPDAVELAAFRGGFVLWYQQRGLPGPDGQRNGWWVHVFEVADDELTAYDCAFRYRYSGLNYLDNDLAAWRVDDDLVVAGAVHYQFDGQQLSTINVEGPIFEGIFSR